MAWDHSSRRLAAAGSNDVTVWDHAGSGPRGRAPVVLERHRALVTALAYQHERPLLASGDRDLVVAHDDGRVVGWRIEDADDDVVR